MTNTTKSAKLFLNNLFREKNTISIETDVYKDMLRQIKEYSDEIRELEENVMFYEGERHVLNQKYMDAKSELEDLQKLIEEDNILKERRVNYFRMLVLELKKNVTEDEFEHLKCIVWEELMKQENAIYADTDSVAEKEGEENE